MKKETNDILTFVTPFILVLCVIVIGILLAFLFIRVGDLAKEVKEIKTQLTPEEVPSGYDTTPFKEIVGKDILEESKDDTIVVLVARQSCGYCALYAPVITKVSENYDFTVRYVDLEKIIDIYSPNWDVIDQESYNAMVSLPTIAGYETFMDDFGATPMTVVIKNGKIIGGVVGYVEEDTLIKALKDSGFLK